MTPKLNNTIAIQTPEGVHFRYHLASPVSRFLAWSLDAAIIGTLYVVTLLVLSLLALLSEELSEAILFLAFFAISIGYAILMESLRQGQTVGKKIFRLRVIDDRGLKLRTTQVVIRNLLRFIDALPVLYSLGGLICVTSRRCQRLGDIAAGTIVIRYPHRTLPQVQDAVKGKFNSLREHLSIVARFRQRCPQELADVALQALLRAKQFDADAKIKLFDAIAQEFKCYATFPEEELVGLTSQQFVRNCVDILYDKKSRVR